MQNANSSRLAYGDVKPGANVILRSMSQLIRKQRPIRGMDAAACEQRGEIARGMATLYGNEIRAGFELDADGS